MNNIKTKDKFIEHFGILGMKWGSRKGGSGSTSVETGKAATAKVKRDADMKNRRRLSDKSLKDKIARLENEKKLKDLTNADLHPGKTMVTRIISQVGEKTAKKMLEGVLTYGLRSAGEKKFDMTEAMKYIAPKPKTK